MRNEPIILLVHREPISDCVAFVVMELPLFLTRDLISTNQRTQERNVDFFLSAFWIFARSYHKKLHWSRARPPIYHKKRLKENILSTRQIERHFFKSCGNLEDTFKKPRSNL